MKMQHNYVLGEEVNQQVHKPQVRAMPMFLRRRQRIEAQVGQSVHGMQ